MSIQWNDSGTSATTGGGITWSKPTDAQPTQTVAKPQNTPEPVKAKAAGVTPKKKVGVTWNSAQTPVAAGATAAPQADGFFKQIGKGVVQGTVELAQGTANAVVQTIRGLLGSVNEHGDPAPPGSLQAAVPALWSVARSLPMPAYGGLGGQTYTATDFQNLVNETEAGKKALGDLTTAWKTQPGTVIGKAIPNAIATFFPYGAIARVLGTAPKVAEAAKVAESLAQATTPEHVYAASDEFAQGMARGTGRGSVGVSAPTKTWQVKPGFTHVEPSARNTSRVNWPPRLRTEGTVAQVLPRAGILKPSPLEGVKPSYGFMNPTTTITTETGEGVAVKGPTADLLKGAGVMLTDPITLEDGMTIDKPVLSGYGVFDAAKGVQVPSDVASQVRDLLVDKPVNNLRAFHPDPDTQQLLQRAVDIVNNIDSPAYIVDPDEFAYSGLSKPHAVEAAAHEAAKRLGAESVSATLMENELKTTLTKQLTSMGTDGRKVGQFIVDRGADAAETSPEAVASRHVRGMLDVWYGLMRSLGMNPSFRANYLPMVVEEGHGAINQALAKARMMDGPQYVPDLLKANGFTDEQIAEAGQMRGDPNDVISRMVKKHKGLNSDDAGALVSKMHANLQAQVDSHYFPGASDFERTVGMQRGGKHGLTLTIDHVLHQGTNWAGLEALSAKTGIKLTPVKDVATLVSRQFANIAKNVRTARLAKALINGQMTSRTSMPGLVPLGVGSDTVYVSPKVREFVDRVVPQHEDPNAAQNFFRGLSAVSKEGTVNWNIAIHAKTLTTGQLSLYGIKELSTSFDDMSKAAAQIQANGPLMYEAAQSGLNLNYRAGQYQSIFTEMSQWLDDNGLGTIGKVPGTIGHVNEKMHSILFDSYAKMLALAGYTGLKRQFLARGMSESTARRAAAETVNDVLGTPAKADVPGWMNKYGYIFFFASQFKLGAFRTMGKAFGQFLPAAATPAERAMIINSARAINTRAAAWQFMLTNTTQYALTKTYSVDNDPGHEFDIWTGTYGLTPAGKREKVYVRLKDFNTDPEIFADKLGEAIATSVRAGKSPDLSPIANEAVSLSGPTFKVGADAYYAAAQRKLDTQFLGTEALDFVTPSWLQALLKQTGEYPFKSFETKVPTEDLWWTALGFSPFGAAPPKQPSLSLGVKGLKGP